MARESIRPHDTRHGPTAQQLKEIDRLANPQTPKDLVDALNNPGSPAYKQMMNLLAEKMAINRIIDHLIERYITQKIQAEQREKDVMFKEMLAKAIADQEKMRDNSEVLRLAAEMEAKRIQGMAPAAIQELWKTKSDVVQRLTAEVAGLTRELERLDTSYKKHVTEWKDVGKRELDERMRYIERHAIHVPVLDPDAGRVRVLDPAEARAMFERARPPVVDEKKLRILGPSYVVVTPVEEPGRAAADRPAIPAPPPLPGMAPPPPPLPPRMAPPASSPPKREIAARDMRRRDDVMGQFNEIFEQLGGRDKVDALFQAAFVMKLNQESRALLGLKQEEVNGVALYMAVARLNNAGRPPVSPDIEAQKDRIFEALVNDIKGKMRCADALSAKTHELHREERSCSVLADQFRARTGKEVAAGMQADKRPDWPPKPSPGGRHNNPVG